MDKITLHPKAQDLLFKYYRALRLIFNDVLGHLEIDYISIALLNENNQLCFFSSRPSIEQNIIEHNLWPYDPCCQFKHLDTLIWNDFKWDVHLNKFKQVIPQFAYALSVPDYFENYKICYSFGLETHDPTAHRHLYENTKILKSIGKFCLLKILDIVEKDLLKKYPPYLKMVVQN